ncbi:MAG: hypothetical protein OEZ57_12240, partial [Nitrospirota bacterium]|nr:hypothetical protein [Nitrospirota bacterium]
QRVNIVEANGTQVVAEVNGTYGVYAQTIKLRGGTLSTKCSCPSTEQPFCRHCVAVLLQQFHLGPSGKTASNGESPSAATPSPEPQPDSSPSSNEPAATVDLNFREATLFIDWMQQAIGSLGKEASLAAVPKSLGGVAREWAGVIGRLNQQFLESEEDRTDAQRNLQSAENLVDSLTKELEDVKGESDAAQKTCSGLEKKVKQLEESLVDFSRISKERDQLVSKVSTMQSELQNKGAELESVSMTLKSLSNAIRNLLPSDPT